jgi:hypothetical protein
VEYGRTGSDLLALLLLLLPLLVLLVTLFILLPDGTTAAACSSSAHLAANLQRSKAKRGTLRSPALAQNDARLWRS